MTSDEKGKYFTTTSKYKKLTTTAHSPTSNAFPDSFWSHDLTSDVKDCRSIFRTNYQVWTEFLYRALRVRECPSLVSSSVPGSHYRYGFVKARECLETDDGDDREEAVRTLNQLLDHPEVESTMRSGDIYFVLVKHYEKTNDLKRAMEVVEDMRDRDLDVTGFLDESLVRKIYRANNKEWDEDVDMSDDDDDDDEIEDEIDDDGFVERGKESEDDDEGYLEKFGTGRFGGK